MNSAPGSASSEPHPPRDTANALRPQKAEGDLVTGRDARRRGAANKRSGTKADAGLLKLIARAHELQEIFTRGGRPISEMAQEAGLSSSYFTRMLRLSFLAPDITRAILHGRQPADLNAHKLMADTRAPIDWHEQRAGLGFI